jgi:hypothetical protein
MRERRSRRVLVLLSGAAVTLAFSQAQASDKWRSATPVDARGRAAVVLLEGQLDGAVVGPLQVTGPLRAVESSKSLRARNLVIRNLVASDLQRDGVRLRGDIEGARLQNFELQMRAEPQSEPNLPIGVAVISGRRIAISDGQISGFRMRAVEGKYTNGDGVAAERKVHDLAIARVKAVNNSDAGFDLKSSGTRLDALRAERNGRNYRFWSSVDAGTLTSVNPRNAHVWAGTGAKVRIRHLVASSSGRAPILDIEGAESVVVERCSLQVPRGTPLIEGDSGRVKLGRGCAVAP